MIEQRLDVNVDEIDWESVPCNLCGADETRLLHQLRERAFGLSGTFQLVACSRCGLIYLNPRPTRQSIWTFYPRSYTPYRLPRVGGSSGYWSRMKSRIKRRLFDAAGATGSAHMRRGRGCWYSALWLIPLVQLYTRLNPRLIPFEEGGSMLDVGCGRGDLCRFMRDLGWEVHGLEPDAETAHACQELFGLDIIATDFEQYEGKPEQFDLVVFHHVLEHLHDPAGSLCRAYRLLRPRGRVLICVPDISSIEYRIFQDDWLSLESPRHLYHFSPITLGRMLRQAGFVVSRIRYEPAEYTLRHSLDYRFHGSLVEDRHGLILLKSGLFLVSFILAILNMGSTMTVVARKDESGRG